MRSGLHPIVGQPSSGNNVELGVGTVGGGVVLRMGGEETRGDGEDPSCDPSKARVVHLASCMVC
jgi:hypothetical protein